MSQYATAILRHQTATPRGVLREVLLVGIGYLIYSQVRGLASDRVRDAFENGYGVVEFERDVGIFKELAFQALLLPHDGLIHFFNFVYFYGLFPLLLPTAAWLFLKRPQVYGLARNAFLISGAIAVCFYLALPTAPPRLLPLGIVDTLGGLTLQHDSIPGANPYAALPSMHVGWSFLTAVSIYLGLLAGRWRILILLLPVAMFTATVATGNHYIIDGVLGIAVALTGLGLATALKRWLDRRAAVLEASAPADQGLVVGN
jgi:hypothetical protein